MGIKWSLVVSLMYPQNQGFLGRRIPLQGNLGTICKLHRPCPSPSFIGLGAAATCMAPPRKRGSPSAQKIISTSPSLALFFPLANDFELPRFPLFFLRTHSLPTICALPTFPRDLSHTFLPHDTNDYGFPCLVHAALAHSYRHEPRRCRPQRGPHDRTWPTLTKPPNQITKLLIL